MKFRDLYDESFKPKWDEIEKIKEFADLKTAPHSTKWHKEGSPWEHTKLVVGEMQKYLSMVLPDNPLMNSSYRLIMLSAALCHDLGKATATKFDKEKDDYVCKNHGLVGEQITRTLFSDENENILEPICYMVRWHMAMHHILDKDEERQKNILIQFSNGLVTVKDMIALWRCDVAGSKNDETAVYRAEIAAKVFALANKYGVYEEKHTFGSLHEKRHFITAEELGTIDENKKGRFDVYVMIGVPGSGKDTYIKKNLSDEIPMICRDDIRTEIGIKGEKPMGNKKQEEEVTRIFFERFDKYCQSCKSFVINNTNVKKRYRLEYLRRLKDYPDANVIYVYMDTPIPLCKERRKGQMPLDVIDRMWREMEFPTMDEYEELRIIHTVDVLPTVKSGNYWQHNSFINRGSSMMCVRENGYQIDRRTMTFKDETRINDEYLVIEND